MTVLIPKNFDDCPSDEMIVVGGRSKCSLRKMIEDRGHILMNSSRNREWYGVCMGFSSSLF
jgi:hypothetical protein